MKIADILDVNVEEIIYGEKKNKDNNQNIIDTLVNEYKIKYKSLKKASFKLLISIVTILILLFVIIYYAFIRGTISIFTLSLDNDEYFMKDSVLVLSNSISTLNFSKIESEKEISYIRLYYIDNDGDEVLIFQGENENFFLEEDCGYNEYNLNRINKDELYIDIIFENLEQKKIKIISNREYINNNIFPKKSKSIGRNNEEPLPKNEYSFEKFLQNQGFVSNNDEYIKYKLNEYKINIYDDNIKVIIESNNNDYEYLVSYFDEDIVLYTRYQQNQITENKNIIPDKEVDCNINKCKSVDDFTGYIYYLKNKKNEM